IGGGRGGRMWVCAASPARRRRRAAPAAPFWMWVWQTARGAWPRGALPATTSATARGTCSPRPPTLHHPSAARRRQRRRRGRRARPNELATDFASPVAERHVCGPRNPFSGITATATVEQVDDGGTPVPGGSYTLDANDPTEAAGNFSVSLAPGAKKIRASCKG